MNTKSKVVKNITISRVPKSVDQHVRLILAFKLFCKVKTTTPCSCNGYPSFYFMI